jgi:hypothetical protein
LFLSRPCPRKSRLAALLDHFGHVEDPRDVRRILHSLPEMLLLVDDYEDIAAWGAAHPLPTHPPRSSASQRRGATDVRDS